MRVLVHAAKGTGRLAMAARGLARRGHEVAWTRAGDAEGEPTLFSRPERWRFHPEVVASEGGPPAGAGLEALLAGAPCLVLGLDHASLPSWRALDRWAWEAWRAIGLVEPAEGTRFREEPHDLELDRLALWSDEASPPATDAAHPDVEVLERACERALARHRTRASRAAVFLDRDGTLIRDTGYIADPDGVELLQGVAPALRSLAAAGYALVVISNQSGVARGLFDLARAHEIMGRLRRDLRREGVELDAIYFCPHLPGAGCSCRKPGTALFHRAADDLGLSLASSHMVGDKWIDLEAGRRAGTRSILVRTGYGREEEARLECRGERPSVVADDLGAAARWILARSD